MAEFHVNLTGIDLHQPRGVSPTPLTLVGGLANAYLIEDETNQQLVNINTSSDLITLGATDLSYDIAVIGDQVFIECPDDKAAAIILRESASGFAYVQINTTNSAPQLVLGNINNNPTVLVTGTGDFIIDGGALNFDGTNIDLDPTGTFDCTMDAGQSVTFTVSDNIFAAFRVQEAGNLYLEIVTTDGSERVQLGNTGTDPFFQWAGQGDFRLTDGSQIRLTRRGTDPASVSNNGFIYTKDVSSVTELFYESGDGTVTQLTPVVGGGGNTLDGAYDEGGAGAGRIITADTGAVEIAGTAGLHLSGTGPLLLNDSVVLQLGTSADTTITHDGTNTLLTHAGPAGSDLIFDNTNTTGLIINRLGTDTSATAFQVRSNDESVRFEVTGAAASVSVNADLNVAGADSANGQQETIKTVTENHTLAAAVFSDTTIFLPRDAVILHVSARVTTTITGPANWKYGIVGNVAKFGTGLALTSGTTNSGSSNAGAPGYGMQEVIRIQAQDDITAFTAGVVRITIHYIEVTPPSS